MRRTKKLSITMRSLKTLIRAPFRFLKRKKWWLRWPAYLFMILIIGFCLSWLADKMVPQVKNPSYGASFSQTYSEELGNNWQANYLALLNDLNLKKLRLMTYWDLGEPQRGSYDFTALDWQIQQAGLHNATVSLSIGYRQPRWPECHEPSWAEAMPVEGQQWRDALYTYITNVVNRYKNNPAVVSYQLENEAMNGIFGGGCRGGNAHRDRLIYEFNLVKKLDPSKPVYMSLSDEHSLPLGKPVPDGYGFSIYRIVYSTTLPIHFYLTYPITDWYHRLRIFAVEKLHHKYVFIHELQMEPWGSKPTEDLTIAEQDRSMSVEQMQKSLIFARKTGIKEQYLWGAEWWYWRKTHFNDPGPWNVIKHTLQESQNSTK